MKKPGVCLFAILVVVIATTNTSIISIRGQMLTPSAPAPSRVHHLIGISQLDCTQYASQTSVLPGPTPSVVPLR